MVKVVQINTVYKSGSTGKIVASIEKIAKDEGYDAYVAYGRGVKESDSKHYRVGNKIDFLFHVMANFLLGKNGFASRCVTRRFIKWLDEVKPDIIHLHNIHGFYIHVGMLFEYIKEKDIPVVWTLHDCWPFTGHCAYFDYIGCNKWQTGCHNCEIHRSDYPYSILVDNSKKGYNVKKNAFCGVANMVIVTPSLWLEQLVRESFLESYQTRVINNGIDLNIFSPYIEEYEDCKIILAVANVWEARKGLTYVLRLSEFFNHTNGYKIVIIGLSDEQIRKNSAVCAENDVLLMGRTKSQEELAKWYSRAYVYVNTSLQENFPTTNIESMACGTPVITFNCGGSAEAISNNSGIVVEKGDFEELVKAINSLESNYAITRDSCVARAISYDGNQCMRQYIDVYKEILKKKGL